MYSVEALRAAVAVQVSVPLGLGLEGTVPPQFLCSGDGRFACVDRSDELVDDWASRARVC